MDAISLTVTAASEAFSTESGGLRVDGLDTCTQPIPIGLLTATSGWIKWKVIPRHDAADVLKFGAGVNIFESIFYFNANNLIQLVSSVASQVTLRITVGGVATNDTWNPATLNAATEYAMEIKYTATECVWKVNGVIAATSTPGAGIDFGANIPNIAYWGHRNALDRQYDAVFIAP